MAEKDRLVELNEQREKILAKSAPWRAKLDEIVKNMGEERKVRDKIKEIEAPLYDIDVERARHR